MLLSTIVVLTSVLLDNGKYGWYTEACAGHTLQLCVKAGLEIKSIKIAIAAAHRLVTHFRKSEVATTVLRNCMCCRSLTG